MSYYRADTTNSQGWRPGTVALGALPNGPNYQVAVARRNAQIGALRQWRTNGQRAQMARNIAVDAAARGVRVPVRRRTLSGLGSLDPGSQMVKGATYVFHFTCAIGLGIGCPSTDAVNSAVSTDANFKNPAAGLENNGGMYVSFQYNGQGSNIVQASAEMASVIQSNVFGYARFVFIGADGPPISVAATVVSTNADGSVTLSDGSTLNPATGVVTNPDGSVSSTEFTPPANNGSSASGFNFTNFLEGLGTGGALALGLGLILVLKA